LTDLPQLSADEIVDRFGKICFKDVRQTKKHLRLRRATGEKIVIPYEQNSKSSKHEIRRFLLTGEPPKDFSCPIEQWSKDI
jgi:predicted RNA binding protein YcfA (HicA-like mRNA interferase family)